ncbi:MAG: hypothetical protein GEU92_09455 [Alphaproteobacteria bacterium]|nr:hypothetical protein [Alphaproteobacteria bacterium]
MTAGKDTVAGPVTTEAGGLGATRVVALCAALLGVVALALGGPSLMGAVTALRANSLLAGAEKGESPAPELLETLVESSYAASIWHGDSRVWFATGLARLASAKLEMEDEGLHRRLLDRAIFALDRGLAMSPSNSIGWMSMGEALLMRAGASPRAARALRMSVLTAPVAPEYAVRRLELLLKLWDVYDSDGRAMIVEQALIARRNGKTAEAVDRLLATAEGEPLAQAIEPAAAPGAAIR